MKYLLLLALCFNLAFACRQAPKTPSKAAQHFGLLSKEEGQKAVVVDSCEGFFERVQPLEIAIQSGGKLRQTNRDSLLTAYRNLLQTDVMDFTEAERLSVEKAMQKAWELSQSIGLDLNFLPKIQLIKTQGQYYGPSVFYTRNASIIIPEPSLNPAGFESLVRVLVHEIFHIYSRYAPKKREALYAAIGFERLDSLVLNDFLKRRTLYNPDGVDLAYAIALRETETDSPFYALPVIVSKHSDVVDNLPFFQYINFRLFKIERRGKTGIVVDEKGYAPSEVAGFYEKIGRNTGYIIHPDEILADNFVLLAYAKEKPEQISKLSPEGRDLLERLKKILLAE
jgi:hypothetical protein